MYFGLTSVLPWSYLYLRKSFIDKYKALYSQYLQNHDLGLKIRVSVGYRD
jgi:hypothetical protein